jgi:uncharacterized protein YjeT (DUF2065 family)
MKWFLYAISLLWIIFGTLGILYTEEYRNTAKRWLSKIDRKILAILPFIFGVLIIIAASASRHSWFIRFIGFVGIAKGLFILASPNNLYEDVTEWYLSSASDQTFRFHGIIALILGTAVLSWII